MPVEGLALKEEPKAAEAMTVRNAKGFALMAPRFVRTDDAVLASMDAHMMKWKRRHFANE